MTHKIHMQIHEKSVSEVSKSWENMQLLVCILSEIPVTSIRHQQGVIILNTTCKNSTYLCFLKIQSPKLRYILVTCTSDPRLLQSCSAIIWLPFVARKWTNWTKENNTMNLSRGGWDAQGGWSGKCYEQLILCTRESDTIDGMTRKIWERICDY